MFVVKIILWILTAFCWWKIFEKAEIKGWKAFIPFYCDYTRFGLADKKWLYFPFLFISIIEGIVNVVYSALAALDLADSLLENVNLDMDLQFLFWIRIVLTIIVFGIGLGILPVVFAPILAFDRSVYFEEKQI